ncbi:hypothetical protein [Pasteurella bettyae]|uniref:hypothetical protein n=1 Tax=Pasteurella bettyae TaxID=752 RepID=UPI003D265A5D
MLSYGTIQIALNDVVARDDIDEMELIKLRKESEMLCETIELGLMELGDMVSRLGHFADSKQGFDNQAMSNDNVKHIGALIQANAYFLNTLRNVSADATYHLNSGNKGAK